MHLLHLRSSNQEDEGHCQEVHSLPFYFLPEPYGIINKPCPCGLVTLPLGMDYHGAQVLIHYN